MMEEVVSATLEAILEGVLGLANRYRRVTAYIVSSLLVAGGLWLLWYNRDQLFEFPVPAIIGATLVIVGLGVAAVTVVAGSAVKARGAGNPNRTDRNAV